MSTTFITYTPWGSPQHVEQLAPGIWLAQTGSHGGFYLDADQNGQVPEAWRNASFNGQAAAGWYEEDCDWCLVALTYPHLFTVTQLADAYRTFGGFVRRIAGTEARP